MRKAFLIIPVILLVIQVQAQHARSEIGALGGVSYYLGDLNPSKHFLGSKIAGGIIYRYNINPRFAFKINIYTGTIQADDAISKANVRRNLSFKSNITDISTQLELNFLPYITGHEKYFISPYIFGGLSLFYFNPQAEYNKTWYHLKPLGTEGQGTTLAGSKEPYSLSSISVPFGLGLKYSPAHFKIKFLKPLKTLSIGLEWGIRKSFTDYIDDVSTSYVDPVVLAAEKTDMAAILADRTLYEPDEIHSSVGLQRGNSKTKDWYCFTGIFITYRIRTKTHCPAYQQHPKIKVQYR